ncbi:MAG TPA: phenylalanine 4-monooxygenase [Gemmatimonadales bacterium]|nr:phenylalanine 4-monooxygenase [Gemmatimonadales bacterium]
MQHDATIERTESLPLTVQEWNRYTPEQHAVWGLLYARRMATLRDTASRVFLEGAATIGLEKDRVPDVARINARLRPLTGWCAIPVEGFLPAAQFFQCLAVRRFPTTITVRAREAIDYVPEPDIFHDVFGHVPLHANPVFAAVLQRLGELGSAARSEQALREVTRLFWFTVEFGLVREGGGTRIYGSGLISSHGDAAKALGPDCDRRPFRLKHVLAQPFEIDDLQPVLFVLDSFEQLFDAVASL